MSVLLRLCFSLLILAPALVHAATLENPGDGSFYSGLGVISGWKCEANGPLTVRFNDGDAIPLTYLNERGDTAGVCGDTNNGFVAIMNWALLGDGTHTAGAYDNGVEFAWSTFEVATTGEPFVTGAVGECRVPDFPAPGESMRFAWNQSTQHLEMTGDSGTSQPAPWVNVCDRTPRVRDVIVETIRRMPELGGRSCENISAQDLASISYFYSSAALDSKGITALKPGDFAGLSTLKGLSLSNNRLTTLPPDLFANLPNLESLSLSGNALTTLPPDLFADLSNLEYLYLNYGVLTTLPPDLFAGLSSLNVLELNHNALTTLPPDLFANLLGLNDLRLKHNALATLPRGMLDDLSSRGVAVELEGNPGYPFTPGGGGSDNGGGGGSGGNGGGDGSGGGGTVDCNNAWTGSQDDIQISSQCLYACLATQAGDVQARDVACSILRQWERHYPGEVLRYCPVCS